MGRKHLVAAVGLAAALTVPLAACGSSGSGGDSGSSGTPSAAATSKASAKPAATPFGAACSKIPTDPSNPGSTAAMAKVPVATAASGNPLLSTLVSLVKKEKLVDTLNGAPKLTVFAPVNDAFAKIPKSTMSKLTDQQIVSILKLHVVGERLGPGQLAGSHKTLNGASVTVSGSGDSFTVKGPGNKTPAKVVCGNVQTANATVYLVDTVLMPAMS
ncbi:fasciclin domain-containing protein [Actinocatenispora comari]|jgi:uncharacterized surface protein with fasciclin (FAS1) repeats|uniref:Lipoprotein n=1 Tax=Actinocatenispora comari TaxID=2807577 RepID=A0A8J4AC13_9ACTN|nr:fasciclin domain-containing protein [Actinocatenispora comari]GIL27915.1 lipoprotein [Actinocatenispora comari]